MSTSGEVSTVVPLLPTEEGSSTTISSSEVTAAVMLEPEVLRGPNTPVRPDNGQETIEAETEDGSDLTVEQTHPLDTNHSPPLQLTTSSTPQTPHLPNLAQATPQTPRLPNLAQAALKRLAHTSNAATD